MHRTSQSQSQTSTPTSSSSSSQTQHHQQQQQQQQHPPPPHLNQLLSIRSSAAPQLRECNLSHLLLLQPPRGLTRLTRLERLSLAGNMLDSLPDTLLCALTRLTHLGLASNELSFISPQISHIQNLVELDLFANRLTSLPPTIANLTCLTRLDLRFNRLGTLPNSMGDLTSLRELCIEMNPLQYPPLNVFRRGIASVLHFLRAAQNGTKLWTHGRVLLLGEHNAGKSTLCKSLLAQGRKFSSTCDANTPATLGLDAAMGTVPVDVDGSFVHLSLWDFGGQHEFQFTHPFFLSAGALFLLVWDLTVPCAESRLVDWIAIVYAIAPRARVLVVGTKMDLPSSVDALVRDAVLKDIIRATEVFKKKVSFEGFVPVSNRTGEGIEMLKKAIGSAIIKCENISFPIPDAYWDVIGFMQQIGRTRDIPVCSFQEFETYVRSVSDDIDPEAILQFLHDAGIVIWHRQPHLRQTIICSARFLVEVFLQIFNFLRNSFDVGSYSQYELLKHYEASFPNHAHFIQELFRQYQLSFPSARNHEVFPSLLPYGAAPTDLWPEKPTKECLSFTTYLYKYDVLPRGIFGQILARIVKEINSQPNLKLARSFFSGSECVFVIQDALDASNPNPIFKICIQQLPLESYVVVQSRSFVADTSSWVGIQLVQTSMRHIHETFDGLDVEECLVCPLCALQAIEWPNSALPLPFEDDHPDSVITCDYGHILACALWQSFPATELWGSATNPQYVQEIECVPTFFWVDVDVDSPLSSLKGTSDNIKPWNLALLCDRPNAPHFVQMPPYSLKDPATFVANHGRLIVSNLNYLAKIHQLPHFPEPLADASPEAVRTHIDSQIQRLRDFEDLVRDKIAMQDTVKRWQHAIQEISPGANWNEHLEPVSLLNGQKRWLCKLCSARFSELYNIEFPLDNIPVKQGYLQKLGGVSGNKWQTRYLVLNIHEGEISYYIDSGLTNLRGTISLKGAEVCSVNSIQDKYHPNARNIVNSGENIINIYI
eukprot:TRINITY_DN6036_c0_g1_i2.p1 TRINITY_DN6036_c0_g1~~TRINITY_DN6036_c0_g1_i2.p1  ORF type:complete len:996 (-),score=198.86 TRINITY_DN6036_c0_g1_i2:517-3504(-)